MSPDHPRVRVSPIFPVTDPQRTLEHYAAPGCHVTAHDESYGFAAMAGVELPLPVVGDRDPLRTAAAYLHVPDADDPAARWGSVERTGAPVDTDDGLREDWHVDPDGDLLRFGSPLASEG